MHSRMYMLQIRLISQCDQLARFKATQVIYLECCLLAPNYSYYRLTAAGLTSVLPAKAQLRKLRQTYNANKLLISQQTSKRKALEEEVDLLKESNTKLAIETSKSQAEKEYIEGIYKDALALKDTNQNLESQILRLKAEIQLLQNNNTSDQDSSARNWFIVGALVLFFGFIIGFVFPKRTNQRRY